MQAMEAWPRHQKPARPHPLNPLRTKSRLRVSSRKVGGARRKLTPLVTGKVWQMQLGERLKLNLLPLRLPALPVLVVAAVSPNQEFHRPSECGPRNGMCITF